MVTVDVPLPNQQSSTYPNVQNPFCGNKVTKYSKPIEIKMTETPTKERRFANSSRKTKHFSEEYITDFKLWMQINNYGVMEFL